MTAPINSDQSNVYSIYSLPSNLYTAASNLAKKVQEIAQAALNKIKTVFHSAYTYLCSFIFTAKPASPDTASANAAFEKTVSPSPSNQNLSSMAPQDPPVNISSPAGNEKTVSPSPSGQNLSSMAAQGPTIDVSTPAGNEFYAYLLGASQGSPSPVPLTGRSSNHPGSIDGTPAEERFGDYLQGFEATPVVTVEEASSAQRSVSSSLHSLSEIIRASHEENTSSEISENEIDPLASPTRDLREIIGDSDNENTPSPIQAFNKTSYAEVGEGEENVLDMTALAEHDLAFAHFKDVDESALSLFLDAETPVDAIRFYFTGKILLGSIPLAGEGPVEQKNAALEEMKACPFPTMKYIAENKRVREAFKSHSHQSFTRALNDAIKTQLVSINNLDMEATISSISRHFVLDEGNINTRNEVRELLNGKSKRFLDFLINSKSS